jgi:hypothetical protein
MKYIITESQHNRLLENNDDYLSRWISDDTPIHVSTFCKYLQDKSFDEIKRLYDKASMRVWSSISDANDAFIKSMGEY